MRELKTEIEINAPSSKVWNILTDFESWADWNPIINQANGDSTLGSKLSLTMKGKDNKDGPKYAPIITNSEEPKYFRWSAKMMAGFLFTNDKIFELAETGSGTRLIHKEQFGGILVPLFWGKLNKGVVPMLNAMNKALKERVEG